MNWLFDQTHSMSRRQPAIMPKAGIAAKIDAVKQTGSVAMVGLEDFLLISLFSGN